MKAPRIEYNNHYYTIESKGYQHKISIDYREPVTICDTEQGAIRYAHNKIDELVERGIKYA